MHGHVHTQSWTHHLAMARILISAALEANEGKWEAIHDCKEGCSNKDLVLRNDLPKGSTGMHVAEELGR